jgi:hypothetical protein
MNLPPPARPIMTEVPIDIARLIVDALPLDGEPPDACLPQPTRLALLSLATVSRTLSEAALDRLWEHATPWRLAILMPPHFIRVRVAVRGKPRGKLRSDKYRRMLEQMSPRAQLDVWVQSVIVRDLLARSREILNRMHRSPRHCRERTHTRSPASVLLPMRGACGASPTLCCRALQHSKTQPPRSA